MDSAATIDLHLPHVVAGGRHLTHYVALGTVLLMAWLLKWRKPQQQLVNVPFYKARMTKWIFDAETLILDSYSKVRPAVIWVPYLLGTIWVSRPR
jgi:hypothetical protein